VRFRKAGTAFIRSVIHDIVLNKQGVIDGKALLTEVIFPWYGIEFEEKRSLSVIIDSPSLMGEGIKRG